MKIKRIRMKSIDIEKNKNTKQNGICSIFKTNLKQI